LANVVFYEKPGCGTNARQKRMLEAAGHSVIARSLLAEPWTAERLHAFFAGMPVSSWFNSASPRVKSGEIDPGNLDVPAALALMLADPLLIRRPLLEALGKRRAGFENDLARALLVDHMASSAETGCSRRAASAPCLPPNDAAQCTQQ
jgi:nitrogenase-associated protein